MSGVQARSAEEINRGLMAVIAWAGNHKAAAKDLKERELMDVTARTLKAWTTDLHREEYERLRDEWGPKLEAQLAHEFRDVAAMSVRVQKMALEAAAEKLEDGHELDPARAASYAARVGQASVDKLMTLTNRPARITEDRNVDEMMRSLVAMGVAEMVAHNGNGAGQITEGQTVEEDDLPEEQNE